MPLGMHQNDMTARVNMSRPVVRMMNHTVEVDETEKSDWKFLRP